MAEKNKKKGVRKVRPKRSSRPQSQDKKFMNKHLKQAKRDVEILKNPIKALKKTQKKQSQIKRPIHEIDDPHAYLQSLGAFADSDEGVIAVMDRTRLAMPKNPKAIIYTKPYFLKKALAAFEALSDEEFEAEDDTLCIQFFGARYPYMLTRRADDKVGIVIAPRQVPRRKSK